MTIYKNMPNFFKDQDDFSNVLKIAPGDVLDWKAERIFCT